jgi:hypothetical protein
MGKGTQFNAVGALAQRNLIFAHPFPLGLSALAATKTLRHKESLSVTNHFIKFTQNSSLMRIIKRGILFILLAGFLYVVSYLWRVLPILSGYGAKDLCSCVLVGGRQPEDVVSNELGRIPLSLGSFSVDYHDSSATGSVFGLARRKAIYRKGLGCTLLSEISEDDHRQPATKIQPC